MEPRHWGPPPAHDDRSVLNGILWVLRTGSAWADLPERFPSSSTCYRRFSEWAEVGVFQKIFEALARDPEERGDVNLSERFIDGTFAESVKQLRMAGPLRRYRRRWKIERLFAWLNTFKRTRVPWDRFHERFIAFVHLAFSMILFRREL